jgi:glutamate synthase domain-containing protein 1/glutamate synthase domain-containing protein 3
MFERIISSRKKLVDNLPLPERKKEEEGGCGVTGFISSIPVAGRHIFEPSIQMHNRGNGKGGGIAAVGLDVKKLGTSQRLLDDYYLLQIALLDTEARKEVEEGCITPFFDIAQAGMSETLRDFRQLGLEVKPPDVCRYFVRAKEDVLARFIKENNLEGMDTRAAEDEFIYQNTYRLNTKFYASLGEKKAFVLSHGRNMMILKIVGYAEQVVQYYCMDDFNAHIWIAHQRYPTKGRVWHPGGAHPFIGLNEALVHNGDFANYYSVSEYLRQRNIYPLFLTDTEVSVLMFDLLNRSLRYPLEYIIEALAPTTELDFDQLPEEKQRIYQAIQSTHIHGSPDGPWFFIIARNVPEKNRFQLIGITDTSMLRPQVFALQEGEVNIGIIASEKQAIDATLHSLASEDKRFCPIADKYWNARGGSHTDGGAFIFTLEDEKLTCTDKFGRMITTTGISENREVVRDNLAQWDTDTDIRPPDTDNLAQWDADTLIEYCREMVHLANQNDELKAKSIEVLTLLNDRRYATGSKKLSAVLHIIRQALHEIFNTIPLISSNAGGYHRIDWNSRHNLCEQKNPAAILVLNAEGFPPEGDECDARLIVEAYKSGWKRFIVYGCKGQRFYGCGLGVNTKGVRIDVYDSSGDYLASGIDGLEIYVHGNAQDQLGQIMKSGKLVIYGDVGQTFMYGAKGGEVYIMGNGAGRPLINAVGKPRVVINGTCLDFLAESFMAGDPLNGGGFVILNGMEFDTYGRLKEQPTPYPGSNLFSLASGGAIYARDPHKKIVADQLNGGEFANLTTPDWELILPYLQENERLFGISIEKDLLVVDGIKKSPEEVYRKVRAVKLAVLTEVEEED